MPKDSRSFLHQIHPKPGEPNDAAVDVVAVHGLNPMNKREHAYNTWTANGRLWLRDFLPIQAGMPTLRVLLFAYNSSAAFQTSTVGVAGAAINLLDQLRFMRRENPDRPIVFVCHSLGGIVVKQALVEAHNADEVHAPILHHTKGIAFFGTPHSGGHGARLGDDIVRVLHAVTGNVRNDIWEWLRTDSFLSNHLALNFARRARNLRVVSFQESLPISRHFGLVVPQSSSGLMWDEPHEMQVPMEATHTTICRFASPQDELYLRVADHMLELIVWATRTPELLVPSVSVSSVSDIPPPPYPLDLNLSTVSLNPKVSMPTSKQSYSNAESAILLEDMSDSEEPPSGWLSRICGRSPFRLSSPRPAYRRASSSENDNVLGAETQKLVWPILMLPYQVNPYYVHRSELWSQMVAMMNKGSPIILQGVGGCGKTQMAIHLSHWFRENNPDSSIMWINAASPDASLSGLGLIASRMGIKNTEGEEHRLVTLKDRLERPSSGHWLMIFDAADSLYTHDALKDFIPRCTDGQVLFTSRQDPTAKIPGMREFVFDLTKMGALEAAALVHMNMEPGLRSRIDPTDVDRLLRKLDYLALALAQAVAFINKSGTTLRLYLTKISDQASLAEELSKSSIPMDYISGVAPAVYATFRLSFERLSSERLDAVRILGYLSFLESRGIPADLVDLLVSRESPNDQPITDLESYSFVHWTQDHNLLNLKRLIQVATQKWLQETGQMANFRNFILNIISDNFPDAELPRSWRRCEIWLPHAIKILDTCEKGTDEVSIESHQSSPSQTSMSTNVDYSRAIVQLKAKIGFYYYKLGQLSAARKYQEEALEMSRWNFGTMDELTLSTQETFIQTLRHLSQIKRASENALDLKRARKANLGKGHKDTLDSYRVYGLTLQDLGKWKDALEASEKALTGYRGLYKSDSTNLDVLRSCRHTAVAYASLGQYSRAEALFREAIDGYKLRNEETSEAAATCIFSLAMLRTQMKRFPEAEATSRRCLKIRKSIMKSSHEEVLKIEWLVGVTLQGQHRWSEAEKLFTGILEQSQKIPGVDKKHTYILQLLYSLGTLEEERALEDESMIGEDAGRDGLYKASAILKEVFASLMELFGPEHLRTLTTKTRLASISLELGDVESAEKNAQEVLKTLASKKYHRLGVASAVITWMCLSTLTGCATAKASNLKGFPGREAELKGLQRLAVRYAKQMVEAMEKTIGKEHLDTLNAAKVYSAALSAADDAKTAAKVSQRFGIAASDTGNLTAMGYRGMLVGY